MFLFSCPCVRGRFCETSQKHCVTLPLRSQPFNPVNSHSQPVNSHACVIFPIARNKYHLLHPWMTSGTRLWSKNADTITGSGRIWCRCVPDSPASLGLGLGQIPTVRITRLPRNTCRIASCTRLRLQDSLSSCQSQVYYRLGMGVSGVLSARSTRAEAFNAIYCMFEMQRGRNMSALSHSAGKWESTHQMQFAICMTMALRGLWKIMSLQRTIVHDNYKYGSVITFLCIHLI